jgi:hypothetical protein
MNRDREHRKDDVLVYVEQDETHRFRIQSSQLEEIGSKLRGPRRFSVFNSIVLPLIISVATILFSSIFQYVSWFNSVRIQNATDNAARATDIYEKVAAIIGKRSYATLVFVPAMRDAEQNGANKTSATTESSLAAFDVGLKKKRFETYYELLRNWNDGYDELLTDVDYNLDRPILLQAGLLSEGIQVSSAKIAKIDCSKRLSSELDLQKLNPQSLKLQFAVIHSCFVKVHAIADGIKAGLLAPGNLKFDDAAAIKLSSSLGDLHTMANEFRCHALRRIDFYKRQREKSILSPRLVLDRLINTRKRDAEEHFTTTAQRCAAA